MTAIRLFVFAFLCTLTITLSHSGVSAADGGYAKLTAFFSDISGNWTCESDMGESYTNISFGDDVHAELLSATMTETQPVQPDSALSLIAEGFWTSLWSGEQVMFEFVSETAFRLISEDSNTSSTLTCTQQTTVTDL